MPATTANIGPGFDCLGLALNLYNTVEMRRADSWSLSICGEGSSTLSHNKDNLVWQTACSLWQHCGIKPPVVEVRLHNNIPLSRGLGSSSAAIVGGLVAANHFLEDPLSREALLEQASSLEGHPDNVAPAIYGGLVGSIQNGSKVAARVLELNKEWKFTVCIPSFTLATSEARKVLPQNVPHSDATFNLAHAVMLVQALSTNDKELLKVSCQDKLHQPYRTPLIPGFKDMFDHTSAAGALSVVVSGAGPTVLAISDSSSSTKAIGKAMEECFARHSVISRSCELKPCFSGTVVERL